MHLFEFVYVGLGLRLCEVPGAKEASGVTPSQQATMAGEIWSLEKCQLRIMRPSTHHNAKNSYFFYCWKCMSVKIKGSKCS
jgi:hypothetical protein